MIGFFSLLKYMGYPVQRAFDQWNLIGAEVDLRTWNDLQAWQIVAHHRSCNAAFNDYMGTTVDDWQLLPVTNKEVIWLHKLDDPQWLSRSTKYYWSSTSGSSGKPFRFSKDLLTHTLTWIHVQHCYAKIGVTLDDWQARFYGIPYTFPSNLIERAKDRVGHRSRFPVLDLSDVALERWIVLLRKRPYRYLYGYSYPLITFAKYLIRTNRVLIDLCPGLKGCILTAEMCEEPERLMVEKAFGVPVCNEYGASEFGILGFAAGAEWEVPIQLIKLEILDDDGNALPDGELGNVTITSLFNTGTPFVRYQPGDLGAVVWKDGKQYLTQLFGRREDMAFLPSGKQTPGDTAFYYIFKDFSNRYDVVKEYKVVQKQKDLFEIRVVCDRDMEPAEIGFLSALCQNSLGKEVRCSIERHDVLDRTRMGKFRRFVSEVQV